MDGHVRMRRSAAIFGAVLVAIGVGLLAYQAGVSHGIAVSGQLAAAPAGAGPYGWYGPHVFFGFGPFFPFLFLLFWFAVLRGLFWGGPGGGVRTAVTGTIRRPGSTPGTGRRMSG